MPALEEQVAVRWRQVRHSAMLYAVLSTAVRVGANLLLVPIVVKQLTTSELATWWVFISLGGLANLADFGFGQAISRVYSYLWAGAEDFDTEGLGAPPSCAEPNRPRLRQFNAAVRHLYLWLSLGSLAVLALGGTFFLMRSSQTSANPVAFWLVWTLYVVSVVYNFGTSHWALACQGINRMREMQAAGLWSGLLYLITAATMLLLGAGLWAMVAASALRGIIARQVCRRAYGESVPKEPGPELQPDWTMVKKLWPNAWKFGLLSLAVYLINNGTVLICSRFLGDAVTASYGLTAQLGYFLVTFSGLWLTVKWPQITILRTRGCLEEMAILFARRLGLALATFGVCGLLLVLAGNPLLEWKGSNTRLLAWPYLVVFLFYLWQQLLYGSFGTFTFTENVVPFYRLAFANALGMIALSLLLTPRFGLWGLILSPLIIAQFGSSWYPIWRGLRGQPLSAWQLARAAVLGHKPLSSGGSLALKLKA